MSRTRLIASLSAIVCLLAAAAVLAVSVFPLKAAPSPVSNLLQTAAAPPASSLAARPVVDANTIWTGTVKRGSIVFVVTGEGSLIPTGNSGNLIAEVLVGENAAEVRLNQSASMKTDKGMVKGHVSRIGPADANGNRWFDLSLDSPLPQGVVANTSVQYFIDIKKLYNILYVSRPTSPGLAWGGDTAMRLFKVIDNGKEAVRVETWFGRTNINTIQVLSGLNEGDTAILSDMFPYDSFDRIQIKQ